MSNVVRFPRPPKRSRDDRLRAEYRRLMTEALELYLADQVRAFEKRLAISKRMAKKDETGKRQGDLFGGGAHHG